MNYTIEFEGETGDNYDCPVWRNRWCGATSGLKCPGLGNPGCPAKAGLREAAEKLLKVIDRDVCLNFEGFIDLKDAVDELKAALEAEKGRG